MKRFTLLAVIVVALAGCTEDYYPTYICEPVKKGEYSCKEVN